MMVKHNFKKNSGASVRGLRTFKILIHLGVFTALTHSLTAFATTPSRSVVQAKPTNSGTIDRAKFYRTFVSDAHVRKQIKFWEAVFQRYDSTSVIIHDMDEPLAMVDVINFQKYMTNEGNITSVESSDRTGLVAKYIDRYNVGIERFAKHKAKAAEFGPIEKRLLEVYQRDPKTLQKLYSGKVRLRGQAGLADTFIRAAGRAQNYIPYMENVFKSRGLPVELTRLPFVESMFNSEARSKVGASGMWQFMPQTAKEYMIVSNLIDERSSPYKSTHAAASLLSENFAQLKSWPLAVTAYNHGRAGMARASRELKTPLLGNIILNYTSPSFGFASKNFFAEFVAAVNTYDYLTRNNKIEPAKPYSPTLEISLNRSMNLVEIAKHARLSMDTIAQLNPCLERMFETQRFQSNLPSNYVLRLPTVAVKNMQQQRVSISVIDKPWNRYAKR